MSQNDIPSWLSEHVLCIECGSGRLTFGGSCRCEDCGASFPLVNRVPLLLRSSDRIDAAEAIAHYLGVDPTAVERAFATALRYRLNDPGLRGEFSQIVERYPLPDASASSENGDASGDLELVTHYFNPIFGANAAAYRSFRIRNNSKTTLSSEGDKPFHLSYFLTGPDGVRIEGARSRYPIALKPGRELTIPVLIQPPPTPGVYKIEIMAVQEFVGWWTSCPVYQGSIDVRAQAPSRPNLVTPPHKGYFDVNEDLAISGQIFDIAIALSRQDQELNDISVLEVACGSDPLTLRHYHAGSRVIASDLSFPQAQLGSLVQCARGNAPPQSFNFVAADVFHAPFKPASFDVVVICAALHHFSDTAAALATLKKFLKPGGRLVLLREPGKVCADDATYIRELESGFNEQQFELPEYDVMFERAGLSLVYEQLDFECSYKAILAAH